MLYNKNETHVVYKASKHVYFSNNNHESIMIAYHAKITSYFTVKISPILDPPSWIFELFKNVRKLPNLIWKNLYLMTSSIIASKTAFIPLSKHLLVPCAYPTRLCGSIKEPESNMASKRKIASLALGRSNVCVSKAVLLALLWSKQKLCARYFCSYARPLKICDLWAPCEIWSKGKITSFVTIEVVMKSRSKWKEYKVREVEGKPIIGRVQYLLNKSFTQLLEEGKVKSVHGFSVR